MSSTADQRPDILLSPDSTVVNFSSRQTALSPSDTTGIYSTVQQLFRQFSGQEIFCYFGQHLKTMNFSYANGNDCGW